MAAQGSPSLVPGRPAIWSGPTPLRKTRFRRLAFTWGASSSRRCESSGTSKSSVSLDNRTAMDVPCLRLAQGCPQTVHPLHLAHSTALLP